MPVAEIFEDPRRGAVPNPRARRSCRRVRVARRRLSIACGGGAVLDADSRERLRATGVVVWLQAPAAVLGARVAEQQERDGAARPLLRDDARRHPRAAGRAAGTGLRGRRPRGGRHRPGAASTRSSTPCSTSSRAALNEQGPLMERVGVAPRRRLRRPRRRRCARRGGRTRGGPPPGRGREPGGDRRLARAGARLPRSTRRAPTPTCSSWVTARTRSRSPPSTTCAVGSRSGACCAVTRSSRSAAGWWATPRVRRRRVPPRDRGGPGADHAARAGRRGDRRQDRGQPPRGQEPRRCVPPARRRPGRRHHARHASRRANTAPASARSPSTR